MKYIYHTRLTLTVLFVVWIYLETDSVSVALFAALAALAIEGQNHIIKKLDQNLAQTMRALQLVQRRLP